MADEILTIDLNTASVDDLIELPGVGAEMARRIVSARPFERVDDLTRVKGISDGVLAKLRPLVVVSSPEEGARGRETKVLGPPAGDIAPEVGALGIEVGARGPETIEVEAKAPEGELEQEPEPTPDDPNCIVL